MTVLKLVFSLLQKLGQPVVDRYREAQEWPVAKDEMGSTLQQIRKFLDQWAQKVSCLILPAECIQCKIV